jgi:hypothetical protein
MGANTGAPIDDILTDLENQQPSQSQDRSRPKRRNRDVEDQDRPEHDDDKSDHDSGDDSSQDNQSSESPENRPNPEDPGRPVEEKIPEGSEADAPKEAGSGGAGSAAGGEGAAAAGEGGAAGGAASGGAATGGAVAAGGATATAEGAAATAEGAAVATEAGAAVTAGAVEAAPVVAIVLGIVALVLLLLLVILPAMGSLFGGGGNTAVANPTSGSTGTVSGNIQDLAKQLLNSKNVAFKLDATSPNGSSKYVLEELSKGHEAPVTCRDGTYPGDPRVPISSKMMQALVDASGQMYVGINALTDKCHTSSSSNHYQGIAVDIDCDTDYSKFAAIAAKYGGKNNGEVCGDHAHFDFPK